MMKIKNFINNKNLIIVVLVLLMIITLFTGTYAWFIWNSNSRGNTTLTMTIGKLADVIFTSGNDINTGLTPVFNYYDGESTTFSINNRDTTGTIINYTVKLNITSIPAELSSESVKYVLVKNDSIVSQGSLYGAIDGTSIDVYSGTISTVGIDEFVFYIFIDSNIENNTNMINKTLVGEITLIST